MIDNTVPPSPPALEFQQVLRTAGVRLSPRHSSEIATILCTVSAHRWQHFAMQRSCARALKDIARRRCAICESPQTRGEVSVRAVHRVCAYLVGGDASAAVALVDGIAKMRREAQTQQHCRHFTVAQYAEGPLMELADSFDFRLAVRGGIEEMLECDEAVTFPEWVLDGCWMLFTNVHAAAVPCTWSHLVPDSSRC